MSSPRYGWWSYAKAMIRSYPQLHREHEALHSQKITASISGMPGGGGASRTTEDIALRKLPGTKQAEHDAVAKAIELTKGKAYTTLIPSFRRNSWRSTTKSTRIKSTPKRWIRLLQKPGRCSMS